MPHISISQLSVEFAVYGSSSRSIKNKLIAHATGGRVMAGAHDIVTVRAIDNLSLEIAKGDRVGLTGHNGSGKTTLLRVLAGIYKPVSGSVSISGRVSALLDTSAGMDPEATGIENIYLRGQLLGLTKSTIESHIDDIAEFTELGDFLALPMRTYSAGMSARLSFAISTIAHNDILLMDEGIGAGDASFQERAEARIAQMFERTSIVVLASHAEGLIDRFCNRRVRLEHGSLAA